MPLLGSDRRCSYEGCKKPNDSSNFHQIDGGSEAGGQDWTELASAVLCSTCYDQFRGTGSLERTKNEPLAGSDRRCSYEGCRKPNESSNFRQIDGGSEAGGQDWTELAGAVLCGTCYSQFLRKGRLERTQNRGETQVASAQPSSKKSQAKDHDGEQQHAATGIVSSSSSSSSRKRTRREEEQGNQNQLEEGQGQVYDGHLQECFMCLGSGTRVCIVPCGHSICSECGDAQLFRKASTRPFSACPVCRAGMRKPWVVEGKEWEKQGKTWYDP